MPIHGTRVSRTYEPTDPVLRKKRVRPFRFKDLEQIPKINLQMHRTLLRAMPEVIFETGFARSVAELVQRYAGMEIDLWFHSLRVVETNRLRALIPGTTCLLVIGILPHSEKIVIEVDLQFVYRAVGKLLGAQASPVDVHRPLTEIEHGVFLFLALKVLALFQQGWGGTEQVALRIEDLRSDVKSTADVFRTEKRWLCATWKLTSDLDVGTVRALLPEGLMRAVIPQRPPPDSAIAERGRRLIRQRFDRITGAKVDAWVEAGRIQLARGDLAGLDPGDIVLLDETKIGLSPEGPAGPTEMRVGLGRHGFFRGEIRNDDGKQVFEVQEIVIEEVPDAHDPIEGHGEPDNPEEVVAAYEERPSGDDESDDGAADPDDARRIADDDAFDEDWGLDDENEGDEEEYEEEEEGYEGEGEEGGYHQQPGGGEEEPADDNLDQVEPLLGDIPMLLVVELGRVQLTADEVIRLRSGQIIELGRTPNDPVDLVVNGKLVAKGELVEIEGSIGVKLLNLVKGAE